MTKSNSSSVPKDEKELISAAQDETRRAAHAVKGRSRKGTGVNWKVDPRRSNIVYGGGVASPAERRANAAHANQSATRTVGAEAQHTSPSRRPSVDTPVQTTSVSTGPSRRKQDWDNVDHQLLQAMTLEGAALKRLSSGAKHVAETVVKSSASLPHLVINQNWRDEAAKLNFGSKVNARDIKDGVETAQLAMNKPFTQLREQLVFSALSVAH